MNMFGSKDEGVLQNVGIDSDNQNQAEDTVIGSTIKIEGDLVSNGNIIVDGEIVGTLKTDRNLRVGINAKVKADVKAAEALVSGEIEGNIDVDGKIELTDSAKVNGDIKARIVTILAGAQFNGHCTMEEGVQIVGNNTSTTRNVAGGEKDTDAVNEDDEEVEIEDDEEKDED